VGVFEVNLAERLLAAALENPDKAAVFDSSGPLSYGELVLAASEVSGRLQQLGVSAGGHVGIALSGRNFVAAYLGVLFAGGVAVPINPRSPAFELEGSLQATDTGLLLCEDGLGPKASLEVDDFRSHASTLEIVDFAELELWSRVSSRGEAGLDTESVRSAFGRIAQVGPDSACVMIMTGGASGEPKAAVLTHASMRANLEQLHSHPRTRTFPGDVALGVLPLFHIFGLNVVLGYSLFAGAAVAFPVPLEHNRAPAAGPENTPEAWAECIARHGVTLVAGSPALYRRFLESSVKNDIFEGVRYCTSGAAPLPERIFHEFADRFSTQIWEGYGLTEASPVVTSSRLMDSPIQGCVGPPLPGVAVEIRDEYGDPVEPGDHGEVWVRGPNVFAGYYKDDESTAASLDRGYLRTGDVGVLDEEGRLYLVDRLKDIVIIGGFNVYPAEVEKALLAHPNVEEAAVVGERTEDGERLVAYVVPGEPGSQSQGSDLSEPTELQASLTAWVAERLARYKVPHEIRLVDELPKSPVAKTRKFLLRAQDR
jgi:long-chain acyl-CoA synthetase